jgi:hypothetical protein
MSITATGEQEQAEETIKGVPVCGFNLSTPVMDTPAYIRAYAKSPAAL